MNNLLLGLEVTLIGLVIVFVMLVLIIGVVKLIALAGGGVDKLTTRRAEKKAAKKAAEADVKTAETETEFKAETQSLPVKEADDSELVAVIAAACAVMMGTTPQNVAVRNIKRVKRTAWANAGRRSQMM